MTPEGVEHTTPPADPLAPSHTFSHLLSPSYTFSRSHESIVSGRRPFRQLALSAGVAERLTAARRELRAVLWGDVHDLMHNWYHKLVRECDSQEVRIIE